MSERASILRETGDLARLRALPEAERRALVYAEDSFSYIQFEGYLQALWEKHALRVLYVSSAEDDPQLTTPPEWIRPFYIDRQLPNLFKRFRGRMVAMTMPDLGQYHVGRPRRGRVVYVFHSLNSAHTAYRTGAFDHYDVFLCTGPHHMRELRRLADMRGLKQPDLREVGYYKLDRIALAHATYKVDRPGRTTVVVAPTWGPNNLLHQHGLEIVGALAAEGVHVIVRPHPQFFHSLYPEGRAVMEGLVAEFGQRDNVEFELSIDSEESFHKSSLMVTDWSGAAPEYALGTLRPVVFVDVPQKIFNPGWEKAGLPSFEGSIRQQIGVVVDPLDASAVADECVRLIGIAAEESQRLEALRSEVVYNFGSASAAGARVMAEVMEGD